MKYFVTDAHFVKGNSKKGKEIISFCKLDGDKKSYKRVYTHKNFSIDLKRAINNKTINKLEFKTDDLLQIEYFEAGELKHAEFFFGNAVGCEEVLNNLRGISESFLIEHAEDNRKNVENLLKETGDKKQQINKIKRMLMHYAKTGTILDASSDKEASEVLSEVITNGQNILDKMRLKLPIKIHIKRGFLVFLAIFALSLIIGMIMFSMVDSFDVSWKLRPLHNFCSWEYGSFLLSGCLATTAFVALSKAFTIASEWKEKLLNSFIVDYERQHDFFLENEDKTKIKKVNDPFIRFIMKDIEYIKSANFDNSAELLRSYEALANEYISAYRDKLSSGTEVNMFSFLSKLTELEISVYSRTTKKGLKRMDTSYLKTVFFEERLPYLGPITEKTMNDPYLNFVFEQAERIYAYPYEGCEAELAELYRIAMDYLRESTTSKEELTQYTPSGKLLKRETQIELLISQKIDTCQKYEKLADDIEKLESLLGSRQSTQQVLEEQKQTDEVTAQNIALKPLKNQTSATSN